MKKYSFAQRGLTLLLAILMVVQLLPMGVLAVTGDIVVGDTGVLNDSLGDEGTINWPIKIYDYLNDGMLFEPATANRITGDTSSDSVLGGWYGLYGGGENMPETLQGTDYTGNSAHYGSGDTTASITTTTPSYTLTKVQAEHYVSPQYMRIQKSGTTDGNSLCLVNFTKDAVARNTPGGYQHCLPYDDVRYMVLVYKGQGIASGDNVQIWLESYSNATLNSSGLLAYSGTWSNVTYDITIPDSDGWSALVVDLATVDPDLYMSDGTATTWDSWNACTAAYLRIPGIDTGDVLDISHVAFFGTQDEAKIYGERAVAFDNDPGECLLKAREITLGEGTPTYYTYPTTGEPGYTFGLSSDFAYGSAAAPSSGPGTRRLGMNFALGTGQNTATYSRWGSGSSVMLYLGSSGTSFSPTKMTVSNNDDGSQDYVRLSSTTASSNIILSEFSEGNDLGTYRLRARYLVLIYRANGYSGGESFGVWLTGYTSGGYSSAGFYSGYPSGGTSGTISIASYNGTKVTDGWVSAVIDLAAVSTNMYYKYVGLNFPTGSGKSLDLAYVAYFPDTTYANNFATSAVAYMNQGIKVQTGTSAGQTVTFPAGRVWNSGNNASFGLYLGNQGGGWSVTSAGASNSDNGGNNTTTNGYYNYRIGYDTTKASTHLSNTNRKPFGEASKAFDAAYTASGSNAPATPTSGKTNQIYYVKLSSWANSNDGSGSTTKYTTNHLDFDGYDLRTTLTSGGMTMGLLEGQIVDGRPVYRQETVEYVAELLYNTLRIPQFDATGNYNYNFVSGEVSDQYATDINGDGDTQDMIDTNGDQVAETSEAAMDLATALRYQLGIKFSLQENKGSEPTYGDYATTAGKELMGTFQDCRGNITTCMDAAYFLLNNLFVGGSYNQVQNDFSYLTLSHATMDETDENGNNKTAYVFDAGYATAVDGYTEGNQISYLDADQYTAQCAVDYNYYGKINAEGEVIGDGTISLMNDQVGSKDLWCYLNEDTTTRFPFMPVVDAEDEYANEIRSPYFRDDGSQTVTQDKNTYVNRNYNYVMASNGEFVYYEDDGLFFEFEGDDDVYLFINGQLVLDIGGAHSITAVKFNVNDYVDWARAEVKDKGDAASDRAKALALTEGQVCQFDFYYMERHGYGANCRIVTNMHVTDPKLNVEKTAYQNGEQIDLGGVVDSSVAIDYQFQATNSGNTKLYNLSFTDETIGVTLDPQLGLVVADGMNGHYVMDSKGKTLEASDLTAVVKSYSPVTTGGKLLKDEITGEYRAPLEGEKATHIYEEIIVTFKTNEDLIGFLHTLKGKGLEDSATDDSEEITQAGSGLWVDASVTISGISYMMTPDQISARVLENRVDVTATTKIDPVTVGNELLRSDASHRVYIAGAPVYYQWADHELFVTQQKVLDDANEEAGKENSQLHQYLTFFNTVKEKWGGDVSKINVRLSNKKGVSVTYDGVTEKDDGYLLTYDEPGTYSFYVFMFLTEGTYVEEDEEGNKTTHEVTYDPAKVVSSADVRDGHYAVILVTVHSTDVEDSVFVLDYGLQTEGLDANGELFKNDHLMGASGGTNAKLMGVSLTQPSFLSYSSNKTDYNRISFAPYDLEAKDRKVGPTGWDGYYTLDFNIPESGKTISYNAYTDKYSLTEVGTVPVHVTVPTDWTQAYLYYWYDDGTVVPAWPGTEMVKGAGSGVFQLDIPADATRLVISNGSGTQTGDLEKDAGAETWISVADDMKATVSTLSDEVTIHITAPEGWTEVYLYAKDGTGKELKEWPGEKLNVTGGTVTYTLDTDHPIVILNNGLEERKEQTEEIHASGTEMWIDVSPDHSYLSQDGTFNIRNSVVRYTDETRTVYASVPESWGGAYLYYWYSQESANNIWPGQQMTDLNSDGWYELAIPNDVSNVIITNGQTGENILQTGNLDVRMGMEGWITVSENGSAQVTYSPGFTFTPTTFMDDVYSLWLALTVHSADAEPSPLEVEEGSPTININKEVQMYKKVTVLPANVVYYEDDFAGIQFTQGDGTFTQHGTGSGILTQEVDQDQPYGQDDAYQSGANTEYSGNSLSQYEVSSATNVPSFTFTFTGTGFEVIGKTNALDAATIIVTVEKKVVAEDETETVTWEQIQNTPVINEFDNGNDGGNEAISQVPIVRVRDLEFGTYRVTVSGSPTYDFSNWNGNIDDLTVVPTQMYVDGLRIFQPLAGGTHDLYAPTENAASFLELRDQIAGGLVAVADLVNGSLSLSSGTMTWTEDLLGDDFDDQSDVFVGNKVDSSDDYLIQGPNNEVYMEGSVSNSALVFYVKEQASAVSHELQLAVRGLDYERFFGTGNSPLSAQLQYGVKLTDGSYAWKPLATVVSGSEQYYSIPYTQCPKDTEGRYQVVIRAAAPNDGDLAMVSYSTLKMVGLALEKVDGVGEATLLYYKNGVLVRPDHHLCIVGDDTAKYTFSNGTLKVHFEEETKVYVVRETDTTLDPEDQVEDDATFTEYRASTDTTEAAVTLVKGGTGTMTVPGGVDITFQLSQTVEGSVDLSYCAHSWNEGEVVQAATCTADGTTKNTCEKCGEVRYVTVEATGHTWNESGSICVSCGYGCTHSWSNGTCSSCGWVCGHNWSDGVCGTCQMVCQHSFGTNGICTNCGDGCNHSSWTDGTCDACGLVCGHSWNVNSCTVCGKDRGLYLFGYINGANYGCVEDGDNIGSYQFVDGQLTVTFDSPSYVAVKTGDNAGWYMTNGYPGDGVSSAVLYNTDVGIEDANKLYVPGGVKVTFTARVGTDDTLTLSYTVDANTCTHMKHYTNGLCIACGADVGHDYGSDGNCTVCGRAKTAEYYLFGFINGSDYACNDDSDTIGIYHFVDGTLTTSFESDSYVAVKTSDNLNWYMTDGWLGTDVTSATLYNTKSGIEANKLFVPDGKEITFTLTVNEDDTLTLSYVAVEPALALASVADQMASTVLVGAANSTVTVPEQPEEDTITQPTLTLDHPSLSFEDEVLYNVYYTAADLDDVVEMGLVTFGSNLTDGTMADAVDVFPGYVGNGTIFMAQTEGIPAANMGDTVYFKVYAKLTDGTYAYSDIGGYNAKAYANTILSGDYADAMKSLVVAMVNYGAEAQLFFGHNTDALVNAGLTEEQKALVSSYDESMVDAVQYADSAKAGIFVRDNANFSSLYPSVSFDGAFSINYYCTPAIAVDDGMTLYWWDAEDYDSITEFTVDNATGSKVMTESDGQYWGNVSDIAAKEIGKTYYVSCVFQSEGETVTTGIISYSLGAYCKSIAAKDGDAQQAFAQATAVYGYYAKEYFDSIA